MINRPKHPLSYRNTRGYNINIDPNLTQYVPAEECETDEIQGMPLAMAYVPWQCWENIYEANQGLKQGTIFADLDLPFYGGKGTESCQ